MARLLLFPPPMRSSFLAVGVATLVGACAPPPAPELEATEANLDVGNGTRLNGTRLNGTRLNGTRLNGATLNGTRLNGTRLNGSELTGLSDSGATLSGADLVGLELEGQTDSGPVPLRIDTAEQDSGLWFYRFSALIGGAWVPVCEDAPDGSQYGALLAAGSWNQDQGVPEGGAWTLGTDQYTVACKNSAIAKCHLAGYQPWVLGEEYQPTHLLACVRMIRADYCGNGAPWTVDGRAIDLWDDLGVQVQTQPTWTFEAIWNPDGAACVDAYRVSWDNAVPPCVLARPKGCKQRFSNWNVLMNRFETLLLAGARTTSGSTTLATSSTKR